MITSGLDQAGGTPRPISGEERTSWNSFTNAYDLADTFKRREGALKFSWDNRRLAVLLSQQDQQNQVPTDGGRILKRLDRTYIDSSLLQYHTSTEILPGSELSDHLPLLTVLHLGNISGTKKSSYRMNTSALQDTELKNHLSSLWKQWEKNYEDNGTPALDALKNCIKRTSKFCQLWGKKKALKRKVKLNKLSLKVQGLLLQLQSDPANIYTQLKLEAAQTELTVWETDKARWIQKHLDKRWEAQGDRATKLFFNAIKARKKQTATHALQDKEGNLHTDQDEMMQLAVDYFEDILQEPPPTSDQDLATEELLTKTEARVTAEEREGLQKSFSTEELLQAAKLLGRNKCPGPDGIPLEFFLQLWDTVAPLLLKATTQGLEQGRVLRFFNKGLITLLPKEGDVILLQNKRPITLLNSVYKIWAKCLQLRLTPVLQRMISWEQSAFLPGRHLHSTIFLCNEAVFEAKQQNIDCVLLKIDFKKAFNTLRWNFLYKVMEKMEFGQSFIDLVTTLNRDASSAIRINSSSSGTFSITRSVRQGCPLSPLLFTIAIQGYFADDAHLLIQADRQYLLNAKTVLQEYGKASGLTVQWTKSKARWISVANPTPDWITELEWLWDTRDEADRFLGFYFKDEIDDETIYQITLQKIKKRLNCHSSRSTTLHGRVVIANHFIYGVIWFILPLWSGNRARLRALETLILRYVWGGDESTKAGHKVAEKVLHQPKNEGGLGLMFMQAQTQAFVAKTIQWALTPGTHPLKAWLRAKFSAIAELRWGSTLHTWITSPSKGAWPVLSLLIRHICNIWQGTAKLLGPLEQLPLQQWRRLAVWGPKTPGVRNTTRSASTGTNATLKRAGIEVLGDITVDGSTTIPLHSALNNALPLTTIVTRAYDRIIDSTPKHNASYRCPSQFAITPVGLPLWCIWLKDEAPSSDSEIKLSHARAGFRLSQDNLLPTNLRDLPPTAEWTRAPVATY
ncbi:hypothetical protein R1sor_015983 [Riccia sorocarpa]|uniref:Reverse transcriptase domain-containing protein n=1 Tax=Riccia sorocarpa TaxID=122646 RepID=A0ABD3HJV4_9MARC